MTIQEKYDIFVRENSSTPSYVIASVVWKDTEENVDGLKFTLTCDDDDNTFFATNGIYEIEELTKKDNGEDFYIMKDTVEFY